MCGKPQQVDLKPDLTATSFSAQNAYFFATLSDLAYETPANVTSALTKMQDCEGLQDNFEWFQVLFVVQNLANPNPNPSGSSPPPTNVRQPLVALVSPSTHTPVGFNWYRPLATNARPDRSVSHLALTFCFGALVPRLLQNTRAAQEKGKEFWKGPETSSKTLRALSPPTTTSSWLYSAARMSALTG